MFELFYEGGTLFMSILTLIFISMLAVSVVNGLPVLKGDYDSTADAARKLSYIKSVGLFGLVVGVMGQMIGLLSAFNAIQVVGDVSPSMLAGGLKVSMITTLYGFLIYVISYLIWMGLSLKLRK